jgi:uncharacterized protein YndB with AHSA1/START domain
MTVSSGTATVTLPTDEQILITREFAAPRDRVYKAWTTPELVKRWWNAKRGEVTVAEIDLRVGGEWRYVMVTDDGFEVGFHGEFREIVPNERIVSTEVYEGAPDAEAVNTITFDEVDGRTMLTILVQHKEKEHRDAHIESGMEAGMQDAMDLLEQVATSFAESVKEAKTANEAKGTEDLIVTHTFDAPIEKVWQLWTDEQFVQRWWAVHGFSNILARMDVREGGVSQVGMRASKEYGGGDYYNVFSIHTGHPL